MLRSQHKCFDPPLLMHQSVAEHSHLTQRIHDVFDHGVALILNIYFRMALQVITFIAAKALKILFFFLELSFSLVLLFYLSKQFAR